MLMNRLLLKESERLRHLRGIWWALRTIMHFLSQTTVAVSGCNCRFEPKVSLCDWNGQTHIRVDATRTVGNKKKTNARIERFAATHTCCTNTPVQNSIA